MNPELKGFAPDHGFAMLKIGIKRGTLQLIVLHLQFIMVAEDDLYVFNTTTSAGDLECLYGPRYIRRAVPGTPCRVSQQTWFNLLSVAMKRAPYQIVLDGNILLSCAGHLSEVTKGAYEEFVPIRVSAISKVVYDPTVKLFPYEPRKAV